MGLFGSIIKGIGDVAGALLPGPVGTIIDVGTDLVFGGGPPSGTPGIASQPIRPLPMNPALQGLTLQERFSPQGQALAAAGGRTTPGLTTGSDLADELLDRAQGAAMGFVKGTPIGGAIAGFFDNGNGSANVTFSGSGSPVATLDRPVVVQPGMKMIAQAPPGYSLVRRNGNVLAVLTPVARSMRLVKPRRKPPISAGDWNKLKTAERVKSKAKRIASTAGFVCRTSKR